MSTPEKTSPPPPPSTASKWRRFLRLLLFFLIAIAGAGMTATAFGNHSYRWRAFTIQVGVRPALTGVSRLEVPPLGAISAHTHRSPLALNARLDAVSFDDLKSLAFSSTPRATLERELRGFATHSATDFAIRLIVWGAVGGFLAPLLLRSRHVLKWVGAPIMGAFSITVLLLATRATFHPEAFEKKPTFTGSLAQAPRVISLVQSAVSNSVALGARLRNVSVNLQALYGRIGDSAADPAGDAGTVRILHISDIHNNPAAISFVRDIAKKFKVAAVIDTGDLSDFGTPVEMQAVQGLRGLGVPYVFVAGNHDSEATVRNVETQLQGIVLHAGDAPVTVAGLRVIGSPDPSSKRPGAGNVDTPLTSLKTAGDDLLAQYQGTIPPPDVVCVHNPLQAEALRGVAPLVLCGHMHSLYIKVEDNTVFCNAGTTGAAGERYLERPEGVPFSAAVLHFSPAKADGTASSPPRSRLLFIDQISLQGSLREYSITRRAFGTAETDGTNNTLPSPKPTQTTTN